MPYLLEVIMQKEAPPGLKEAFIIDNNISHIIYNRPSSSINYYRAYCVSDPPKQTGEGGFRRFQ